LLHLEDISGRQSIATAGYGSTVSVRRVLQHSYLIRCPFNINY